MKIVSGQQPPDEGRIRYLGEERHFKSVSEAEHVGIAIIHQELNLVPHLTVAENIFLAREPVRFGLIDRRKMQADTEACLARLGVAISPRAPVAKLSVAQQQMVEIAKALSLDARVLILDEPTSSLTESETQALFKVIQDLKARGVGMLYISHRLDEMRHIVDRVTILRDGRYVSTQRFADTSVDAIVAGMVGRSLDEKFPPRTSAPTGEVLLRAQGLSRKGVFQDISFELRRGEILGFAGLMGAGRTEIARAIFGADRLDAGQVEINGRAVTIRSPRDGIDQGIAYLSEDRKKDGLAVKMTLAHNLTLANLGCPLRAAGLHPLQRGGAGRPGLRAAAGHPHALDRQGHPLPLGRQPAKDHHRQMAVPGRPDHVLRRAHPGHRRRRQVRHLRNDGPVGGPGHRCRPDQFGVAGIAGHERSDPGLSRRSPDR